MGHFYHIPSHKAQDHHGRECGKTGRARGYGGLKRKNVFVHVKNFVYSWTCISNRYPDDIFTRSYQPTF